MKIKSRICKKVIDLYLISYILVYMNVLIVKNVPDELKKQFKLICIGKDTTMSAEVVRFIRAAVAKKKNSS